MSDTTKDAVLKPCPFCGGHAEIEKIEEGCFGVGCPNCDFQLMNGQWAIGWHETKSGAAEEWNRRAPAQVQADAVQVGSISRLVAFHAEQLEANPYCYFELAYTRQTDWMAWITDRPAQGEPGTAAYAKSRKVIVRGQGATAEEACADALAALTAPSTGDQS